MKNFTPKNYKWSVKGLERCIAENGMKSEIIYVTPSAAIVKVDNYEDSIALGAVTDWCICQHSCSWKQYISEKPNNVQIFFYNFGLPYEDYLSVVGATFEIINKSEIKLEHCFSRENKPLCEKLGEYKDAGDLYALNELIMKKNFGCSSAIHILIETGITEYYQPTTSFRNDEEIVKKLDDYNKDCDKTMFIPSGGYSYTPIYIDYEFFDNDPF